MNYFIFLHVKPEITNSKFQNNFVLNSLEDACSEKEFNLNIFLNLILIANKHFNDLTCRTRNCCQGSAPEVIVGEDDLCLVLRYSLHLVAPFPKSKEFRVVIRGRIHTSF